MAHIVLQIPQKLCGYLVWTLQFCWHCLFDQFSLLRAISFSVCTPLFHVAGLSPSGASTTAVALISTCVDMTGISSELFSSFSIPFFIFPSPTRLLSPIVPRVAFECSVFFRLTLLLHSHSPSVFHSVSLFLSPALSLSLPGVFN